MRVYFADLFEQHGEELTSAGVNPNDGLGALLKAIEALPDDQRDAVRSAIDAAYESGPPLAMVDSERGITNLHVPSDVIIDASMPAAIRSSGQMWNARGEQQDTKFVIPDHSYAALYAETRRALPRARRLRSGHDGQHAEHRPDGTGGRGVRLSRQDVRDCATRAVRVVRTDDGETLLEHAVSAGDIWRMCQTKDAPIQDWVQLAVTRARETGTPAVFWLDETRAHDAEVLRKVRAALEELDTDGLEIEILDVDRGRPSDARARPRRPGHDLSDRQRPARLPHRPVPDPRARDERQDAVDRSR